MKVFVTGATGIAGSAAVPALAAAGHAVTAVARTEAKAQQLRGWGATPVLSDVFDPSAASAVIAGHEAVINLATHIPPLSKASLPGAWKENDRIRRELSATLVEAAIRAGVGTFVQESIGFLYADAGAGWIDESMPVSPTSATRTALDAEGNLARFTASGGTGVVLRFAQFYGAGTSHTDATVRTAARLGVLSVLGAPESYLSNLHRTDVGTAVVAALAAPAGIYNIGDDEPLQRDELSVIFAKALGRKRLRTPGAFATKLGGEKAQALARSQRLSNQAFRTATGWAPSIASGRDGWPAVIAAVQAAT